MRRILALLLLALACGTLWAKDAAPLAEGGNPYDVVAVDADGRVGIDYGVYGVPETYVIDRNGVIVHKHIGPVTQEVLDTEIRPILSKLGVGAAPKG